MAQEKFLQNDIYISLYGIAAAAAIWPVLTRKSRSSHLHYQRQHTSSTSYADWLTLKPSEANLSFWAIHFTWTDLTFSQSGSHCFSMARGQPSASTEKLPTALAQCFTCGFSGKVTECVGKQVVCYFIHPWFKKQLFQLIVPMELSYQYKRLTIMLWLTNIWFFWKRSKVKHV